MWSRTYRLDVLWPGTSQDINAGYSSLLNSHLKPCVPRAQQRISKRRDDLWPGISHRTAKLRAFESPLGFTTAVRSGWFRSLGICKDFASQDPGKLIESSWTCGPFLLASASVFPFSFSLSYENRFRHFSCVFAVWFLCCFSFISVSFFLFSSILNIPFLISLYNRHSSTYLFSDPSYLPIFLPFPL